MSEFEKTVVASFAKALENISDEAKAELIKFLSKPSAVSEKMKEESFYSSLGGWSDWNKTTEESVEGLQRSRLFR